MSSPARSAERPGLGAIVVSVGRWAIALALLFFIGRWLVRSWDEIQHIGLTFSMPRVAASIVLLGAYMAGRALVWHHLTLMLGTAIPLRLATVAWFYSQLGKYIPGKVFLFLARLYFYVREGRAAGPVGLAFGIELVATFLTSILIVLAGIFTLHLDAVEPYGPVLLGAVVALCVALHPRILNRILGLAARVSRRPPFAVTLPYGRLLEFVGLYLVNTGVFGCALYVFIRSFYPLGADSILFAVGAFFLAALVGMAAVFVPAGLGVREGVLVLLLTRIMPEGWAVMTAVLTRIWFSLVELTCVGIVWVALGAFRRPVRGELERLRATELDL